MLTRSAGMLTLEHVEALLTERATEHARAQRLVVDYYRIRRQIAWPLPVVFDGDPEIPTRLGRTYPWSIWLTWALDERVHALAWSANRGGKDAQLHAELASEDLAAITRWSTQAGHPEMPHLMYGHVARLIGKAHADWAWVSASLRDELSSLGKKMAGQWHDWAVRLLDEHLAAPLPTPNITLIGLLGVLQAGFIGGDDRTLAIREPIEELLRRWLNHYAKGYSEGVAYDGYIWDHAVDCLSLVHKGTLPVWLTSHPKMGQLLSQSYELACPGKAEHVAEIGDVEPREMSFHLSLHVKLLDEQLCPPGRWLLDLIDLSWLRNDALAMLQTRLADKAPLPDSVAPLRDAQVNQSVRKAAGVYTHSLRTGWQADDLAAIFPCTNSHAGHLHMDAGHVVLGTQGQWLISDPGYQQYLQTTERKFTLGPQAHNDPVILGKTQATRGVAKMLDHPDADCLCVDTTACYQNPEDISPNGLSRVIRCVWMLDASLVVVADDMQGSAIQQDGDVQWSWHGCPTAACWVRDGQAEIHVAPDITLYLSSPNLSIIPEMLDRLPGSRGQQTIHVKRNLATRDPQNTQRMTQWWIFAIHPISTPEATLTSDGLSIGSRCLTIPKL